MIVNSTVKTLNTTTDKALTLAWLALAFSSCADAASASAAALFACKHVNTCVIHCMSALYICIYCVASTQDVYHCQHQMVMFPKMQTCMQLLIIISVGVPYQLLCQGQWCNGWRLRLLVCPLVQFGSLRHGFAALAGFPLFDWQVLSSFLLVRRAI